MHGQQSATLQLYPVHHEAMELHSHRFQLCVMKVYAGVLAEGELQNSFSTQERILWWLTSTQPWGLFLLSKALSCAILQMLMSLLCPLLTFPKKLRAAVCPLFLYSPVSVLDDGIPQHHVSSDRNNTVSAGPRQGCVHVHVCVLIPLPSWAWPQNCQFPSQWFHVQSQHCTY